MLKQRSLLNTLVLIMLTLALSACGHDSKKQLHQYVKNIKTRKGYPIQPIPQTKPIKQFSYPSVAKRNPFKPNQLVSHDATNGPNQKRLKQFLEQFPLDALKMVGVLHEGKTVWALIEDPDGAVHRIQIGEYMGQHYGKVTAISEQELKLNEKIRAGTRWEDHSAMLKIKTEE